MLVEQGAEDLAGLLHVERTRAIRGGGELRGGLEQSGNDLRTARRPSPVQAVEREEISPGERGFLERHVFEQGIGGAEAVGSPQKEGDDAGILELRPPVEEARNDDEPTCRAGRVRPAAVFPADETDERVFGRSALPCRTGDDLGELRFVPRKRLAVEIERWENDLSVGSDAEEPGEVCEVVRVPAR